MSDETQYATVSWAESDIADLLEERNVSWSVEQVEDFMVEHENHVKGHMTEAGWDVWRDLIDNALLGEGGDR